jgi:hypothetical protein
MEMGGIEKDHLGDIRIDRIIIIKYILSRT